MALANVAFLAAMDGLNVLVMDWDLEAPGLHHYFRGLVEPDKMSELRSATGILDLAWSWRNGIDLAKDAEAIDQQFAHFRDGAPFENAVINIMHELAFGDCGRLDIIPAGGSIVSTPEPVEYERALAAMSWNELLDRYAGGGLIDALRDWASANYDLILVDSRTGLADVSGICTMQLPDAVALCFVLNRQNIEGVARVASAIRRNRGEDLKIWAIPMRVSREGTDEEADATARALRELTRPGRLDRDSTEHDLKNLLVKAEPNVPFMESLSAFNDTNAALDPMTANMARLASSIVGRLVDIPEIPEQWRDVVSNRLAPTLSTDSYLRQLLTAEPTRAARQLHGYVESAISTLVDESDIADDYVVALAEAVMTLQQRGDAQLNNEFYDTPNRVILLLRKMHERAPEVWRPLLIQALETTLNSDQGWMGPEDEAIALDEIDELLASEAQDNEMLERRVTLRLRASRLFGSMGSSLSQLGAAEDALLLIKGARKEGKNSNDKWQTFRFEALLQRATAQERLDQPEEAAETLRRLIRDAEKIEDGEFGVEVRRAGAEGCYRLMRLLWVRDGHESEAAELAIKAVSRSQPNSPLFVTRIAEFADVILAAPSAGPSAALLLRHVVMPPMQLRTFAHYFGRAPAGGARLTQALSALLLASQGSVDHAELLLLAERASDVVFHATMGSSERIMATSTRRASGISSRPALAILPGLVDAADTFLAAARSLGADPSLDHALERLDVMTTELRGQAAALAAESTPRSRRLKS